LTALTYPEEHTVHRIAGMPPDEEALKKYGLDPDPAPPGITDSIEADAWNNLYYVLSNGSDSRLRTHNQNMTVAARAIAERKTVGDLS
jgi:hypothetical protein